MKEKRIKVLKYCIICGGEFYSSRENAKFDKPECRKEEKRLRAKILKKKADNKICKCGESIPPNRRVCDKCKEAAFREIEQEEEEKEGRYKNLRNQVITQPNGVDYYGFHGIIAKGSESWSGN